MTGPPLRLLALAMGSAVFLAGCQTLFPKPKPAPEAVEPAPGITPPTEPLLPVPAPPPPPRRPPPQPPRSCVPKSLGPPPSYPDNDAALRAAPGAADRYQLMAAGRILRQERLEELERAVAACR